MDFKNIYLPDKAVIVEREMKKVSSILITESEKTNKGIVIATCENLKDFIGAKVVFRENFSEPIEIEENKNLLFFRDFDVSIYYAETNKG